MWLTVWDPPLAFQGLIYLFPSLTLYHGIMLFGIPMLICIYFCLFCIYLCIHACHSSGVKVRGQSAGAGFLFPPCVSGEIKLRSSGFGSGTFAHPPSQPAGPSHAICVSFSDAVPPLLFHGISLEPEMLLLCKPHSELSG